MKKFKYRKKFYLNNKRILFILVIVIIINTIFNLKTFANKLGSNGVLLAEKELEEITVNLVTKSLSREKLTEIAAEDLIIIKYNKNDEITNVDFKLDRAYDVLIDIKQNIETEIRNLKKGDVPSSAVILKDNLIIKIPYYSYTNNVLLMNLGPKIYIKAHLLENIVGDVYTKISSYGINTVLVNLYIKFNITESLLYSAKTQKIEKEFEVLIATKILQGKIPNFYNGVMENSSSLINTK